MNTAIESTSAADSWRVAAGADLCLLARLHEHELRRDDLVPLWARCYDGLLRLEPKSRRLHEAQDALCRALTEIPTCFDAQTAASLHGDYQRVHALGPANRALPRSGHRELKAVMALTLTASPLGPGTVDTGPQDATGDFVDPFATCVALLAQLTTPGDAMLPAGDLRRVIEVHLLDWADTLAEHSDSHCSMPLYRALAGLTAQYLRELCALCRRDEGAARAIPGKGVDAQHSQTVRPPTVRAYLDSYHLRTATGQPAR